MVEGTVNVTNKPKVTQMQLINDTVALVNVFSHVTVREEMLLLLKYQIDHCNDYNSLYHEKFALHEINGRALLRMNDNTLLHLGIVDKLHREAIWREILQVKLRTDIMEIMDLQRRNMNNIYYDYSIA